MTSSSPLSPAGINSEVKYSLLAGDSGYFSLDEFSGILRLERPLTPDTPPTFELKVKATDRGLPRHLYSVATVTVDVVSLDDYQPVFLSSEYTAQLPESLAVGSEVLSVSALTRDGGGPDPISYRIVSGNDDGQFLLDSGTGQKHFYIQLFDTLDCPVEVKNFTILVISSHTGV